MFEYIWMFLSSSIFANRESYPSVLYKNIFCTLDVEEVPITTSTTATTSTTTTTTNTPDLNALVTCGSPDWADDRYCDDDNNNEDCNGYDGGACCEGPESPSGWNTYCDDCICYCSEVKPCGIDDKGDCIKDEECQLGLVCGSSFPNENKCVPGCSPNRTCEVDEGPCNSHEECKGDFKCGTGNCEIEKEIVNCCFDPAG